jgi:hypothetical protein
VSARVVEMTVRFTLASCFGKHLVDVAAYAPPEVKQITSTLSALPWLVTLSRHKQWTFAVSGILIALSFLNMYYIAPRLRTNACTPENPSACADASKFSRVLLWVSAAIYVVGFFSTYILGPILTKLDN